jgi:hypothetical protein
MGGTWPLWNEIIHSWYPKLKKKREKEKEKEKKNKKRGGA